MTAPAADSSAQPSQAGLRPGVLKVRHAVITSLAVITPAAAILFLPIPIAANAGAAMPLSIVVAFVVVLVIMNAVRFVMSIPDLAALGSERLPCQTVPAHCGSAATGPVPRET